mgnify:CR=1 FL=1|jgi:hypothetical protein
MEIIYRPLVLRMLLVGLAMLPCRTVLAEVEEVPLFITIGQSNADGSAFADAQEDERLQEWYTSSANSGKMKMWYRSTQVENQEPDSLGVSARWVVDGSVTDVEPGWLNLWYRNENTAGRTAMNMIHTYGTYSECAGSACAQGRRGMEGEFGMKFQTAFPDSELYMLKLGASGSSIATWADSADSHNWNYFYNHVFKPAVEDLISKGKRPRLAGIWWMQGCADMKKSKEYYEGCLKELVRRCRVELGFADARIYVGHIVKPGESKLYPEGSKQYGQSVRDAQDAVAETIPGVEIIAAGDFEMQYEEPFRGYVHFNHRGMNAIGDVLAAKVIADKEGWASYSTPGYWNGNVFVPMVGAPNITYSEKNGVLTATLDYGFWSETCSKTCD